MVLSRISPVQTSAARPVRYRFSIRPSCASASTASSPPSIRTRTFRPLTFHDAVPGFLTGDDTPRAYLERCLETIAQRESVVRAWVVMNQPGAREAADASAARWKAGRPLSAIDGMPVGIKDLLETRIRPAVAGDGGDITFRGYRDGTVYLAMKGSCSGCPSSTATLKHGIQNLLRHFVPEVQQVEQI